jgi:alkylation response protein AidB-like acyl-CoA dehydrogenase
MEFPFFHAGSAVVPRPLFTSEHETFRDSARRVLEAEVKPFDERWQDQRYADKAVWRKAGGNGFLCMSMPEENGGSGAERTGKSIRPWPHGAARVAHSRAPLHWLDGAQCRLCRVASRYRKKTAWQFIRLACLGQ